jgi:polyvinyl alcohol dehydrogenase (cytochrome)
VATKNKNLSPWKVVSLIICNNNQHTSSIKFFVFYFWFIQQMTSSKLYYCGCLSLFFSFILAQENIVSSNTGGNSWTGFGNGLYNSRYQPSSSYQHLNFLTPKNFTKNWFYPASVGVSSTPTVTSNRIYFADLGGYVYSLRLDGTLVWKVYLQDILSGNYQWLSRSSPLVFGNLLLWAAAFNPGNGYPTVGPSVFALNINTGALVWSTVVESHFAATITTSPTLVGSRIIVGVSSQEEYAAVSPDYPCCSFRGSVVALNAITGHIEWQTYTLPDNNGLPGSYAGASVWGSSPSVDVERGFVFVSSANNYALPAYVEACQIATNGTAGLLQDPCQEEVNHSNSILALDLYTGVIRWSVAVGPLAGWNGGCGIYGTDLPVNSNCPVIPGPDFGFGQAPILVRNVPWKAGGQPRDQIYAGNKSGKAFGLDAETGRLSWSTQVSPGSQSGGMMFGSATDGKYLFVGNNNGYKLPYTLANGATTTYDSWAALNLTTGDLVWSFVDPAGLSGSAFGPITVWGNIVLFGSKTATGGFYGVRKHDGKLLYQIQLNNVVGGGAAVASNRIYIGSGYAGTGLTNAAGLYSLSLPTY